MLVDSSSTIKVPKMMPNTQFTETFIGFTSGVGDFPNAALVGNFMTNLILSGTMNLLWSLLHSVQIIAHFPLINIMIPTNA